MRRSWVSLSVVILSCALGAMPSARASSVTVAMFDVPGATETYALGINGAGQIVGHSKDAAKNSHGFVLAGGRFTPIDVPGRTENRANGINTVGQIVGSFQSGKVHGHVRSPGGSFTTIDVPGPGATFTEATGINDAGYRSCSARCAFSISEGRSTIRPFSALRPPAR